MKKNATKSIVSIATSFGGGGWEYMNIERHMEEEWPEDGEVNVLHISPCSSKGWRVKLPCTMNLAGILHILCAYSTVIFSNL